MQVWFWHTEPPAHVLPGAKGWGWFFRYLTFYGFTVQTVQLNASLAAAFTVNVRYPVCLAMFEAALFLMACLLPFCDFSRGGTSSSVAGRTS